MAETIALLGLHDEGSSLSRRARDIGWSVEAAHDISELGVMLARRQVIAVYFDPRSLQMTWQGALGHVLRVAPGAFPIVCLHFSDRDSVDQITAQGGFYVLHVPFAEHEVQQSLGFLQAALARKPASPEIRIAAIKSAQVG